MTAKERDRIRGSKPGAAIRKGSRCRLVRAPKCYGAIRGYSGVDADGKPFGPKDLIRAYTKPLTVLLCEWADEFHVWLAWSGIGGASRGKAEVVSIKLPRPEGAVMLVPGRREELVVVLP